MLSEKDGDKTVQPIDEKWGGRKNLPDRGRKTNPDRLDELTNGPLWIRLFDEGSPLIKREVLRVSSLSLFHQCEDEQTIRVRLDLPKCEEQRLILSVCL